MRLDFVIQFIEYSFSCWRATNLYYAHYFNISHQCTPTWDVFGLVCSCVQDSSGKRYLNLMVQENYAPNGTQLSLPDVQLSDNCIVMSFLTKLD